MEIISLVPPSASASKVASAADVCFKSSFHTFPSSRSCPPASEVCVNSTTMLIGIAFGLSFRSLANIVITSLNESPLPSTKLALAALTINMKRTVRETLAILLIHTDVAISTL